MTLAHEFMLDPRQALAAFGAARAVVEADGVLRAHSARLLEVMAATLELGDGWRALPAARPEDVALAFPSEAARRVLVDALILAACIEGEVTKAGEARVRAFADGLGVRSPWVTVLPAMRRGCALDVLELKRTLASRSPDARRLFQRTWSEEGVIGLGRALLFVLGAYRNPALAARFRALGALPAGTLGRAFFDHLASRGLTFPGERGGIPERMIHHDILHVLNHYGTDPAGECELAGFYAGFCPGEPFTFIMTALATFHLGMKVSPAVVEPARGAFDPARVVAAFLRGRRLRVDVMGPWDYWALMPLPIGEALRRLGLADGAAEGRRGQGVDEGVA
jgi:hypothetical protein